MSLHLTDEDRAALAKIFDTTLNRPIAREDRIALHFLAAGIERVAARLDYDQFELLPIPEARRLSVKIRALLKE